MSNTTTEEFSSMFAPTTPEEAASQSATNRSFEIVADILKKDTPRHQWEEGDNWMRFLNPFRNPWYIPVEYYEVRQGNKIARVIHQDSFGEPNLLRAVQIGLYQNPETRPRMKSKENPDGFYFREHRKALLVAARWENTLTQFAVVQATLGRLPYRKDQKYREAWGDALIKLPAEVEIDPTLPAAQQTNPKPRWGAIFDPVYGRLIKCSFANVGTMDITASFTPAERTLPVGKWEEKAGQKTFVPLPQYADIIRNAPNVKNCLNRVSVDQQKEIVRTFVPTELLPYAEKAMQAELSGENRKGKSKTVEPAATVSVPVPQEEPAEIGEADHLYVDFVQALGPKFREVGEETVRKLIKLSMVNPANLKQMAAFAPEILKSIASAS
jgi:hypothetical protein